MRHLFAPANTVITRRPGASLLPVMDPAFNLREIVKQMILLEDHLNQPLKRCPDCIGKHLLWWEALAEEGCCLDKTGRTADVFERLAATSRMCQHALLQGADPAMVAQWVRAARKSLMPVVFPWGR